MRAIIPRREFGAAPGVQNAGPVLLVAAELQVCNFRRYGRPLREKNASQKPFHDFSSFTPLSDDRRSPICCL